MNQKLQKWGSLLLLGMAWMHSANALTGNMFQVTSSGIPATISIRLCLSAGTSKPNSQSGCEDYNVTGMIAGVKLINLRLQDAQRFTACRPYNNVGIMVATPGYTVESGATLNPATGYYAFSADCSTTNTIYLKPANAYSVGGNLTNLTGTVVLQNNGGDNLTLTNNGSFTFSNYVTQGSTYDVTVLTQPSGQTCTVTNRGGTMGNSNVTNVGVNCTNNATTISINSPAQLNRFMTVAGGGISGTNLTLNIKNTGSSNASNIIVSNKSACPNLSVNATACTNLASGQTCNLILSSSMPYVPCNISIQGTNTNTLTTYVAFLYLNGWVFAGDGTTGKVVGFGQFLGQWTNSNAITGANSADSGAANTDAIVGNPSCSNNPANCAAQRCRNMGGNPTPDWYLPALNELNLIYTRLKNNQFGAFSNNQYWSSTEYSISGALRLGFNDGNTYIGNKNTNLYVRCVRAF